MTVITTVIGRYFSVQKATPFLDLITGNAQLEDSFDLSILNENPMVPQSSLGFYLEWLTKEGNLATVNHEWHDHQPGWTKQQHYSHRWPLTCHGWLNQYCCHGWLNQY